VIITRLGGGLGHQLFQYAAGRRLSLARGAPLQLDRSALDAAAYALAPFAIVEAFAPANARAAFEANTMAERAVRFLRRRHLAAERSPRFDPAVLELPGDVYLEGQWQSEQYFGDVAPILRRELTWKAPPQSWAADILARLASQPGVAVHVRRGGANGACPVGYYRRAWRLIKERVPDPWFLVFADDPAWARAQLTFLEPARFVSDPGHRLDHEELWLMTKCRHHVIANSAFSWWGAWLAGVSHQASAARQIVVAPDRWFADPGKDGRDVVPPSWARASVD
jgi:hypothetical protein